MGGDYNARTGNEGGPVRGEEGNVRETRKLADKTINREGKLLVNKIEERGWMILNGSYDIEGGWTYVGEAGKSVIDYVIANEKTDKNIIELKGDRTESDHVPLELELEGPEIDGIGRARKKRIIEKNVWT